jgi:phosphoglycolate phosphatase
MFVNVVPRYLPTAATAVGLARPNALIFDWHGTLVDTRKAMYNAMDDMLARFDELQLLPQLVSRGLSKTAEDERLVEYVRQHRRLPEKIRGTGRLSRTDVFEILFGANAEAKRIAHAAYNAAYRNHYGEVHPLHGDEQPVLATLRAQGIGLAIASNRDREFLERELAVLDGGSWQGLFDVIVCGGDTPNRKPAPDPIVHAVTRLGRVPGRDCWYVGDAASDVGAARRAGVASVFFNSAGWTPEWLAHYFPGSAEHPDTPDVVVSDCRELERLIARLTC